MHDCGTGTVPARGRTLFLDRDGVVNVDAGYTHRCADFVFMPGIFDLAAAAVTAGMGVVVITNQAGIGRGYYDEAALATLSRWMVSAFAERGVPVARVYYCPHHPDAPAGPYRRDCPCRKPSPGMLLAASRDLGISLPTSMLVGDKATDVQAGAAAGVGTLALLGADPLPAGLPPVQRASHLESLARLLF